jgi:CRP-like cAMP-binding protein
MPDSTQNPLRLTERPVPGGLLRTLHEMDVRAVEQHASMCGGIRGQILVDVDSMADKVVLLYEGVALDYVNSNGRWLAAEILTGGDLTAQAETLPDRPCPQRLVADTAVVYALISRSDFTALLRRHPLFASAVADYLLARRAALKAARRVAACTDPPRVQFARTLADLYDIYTTVGWKPHGEIPLRRDDLAGLTGIPRRRVPGLIGELKQAQILRPGPSYVSIEDIDRLRQCAQPE